MGKKQSHFLDRLNPMYYASFIWILECIVKYSSADLSSITQSKNTMTEDARLNRDRISKNDTQRGLIQLLYQQYRKELLIFTLLKFLEVSSDISNTYFTIELTSILDVKNKRTPVQKSADFERIVPLMIYILIAATLRSYFIFYNQSYFQRIGFRFRSGISALMFKKMLDLSLDSYTINTPGRISAMIQVDVENVYDLVNAYNLFMQAVFTFIYIGFLFGYMLGPSQLIIYLSTAIILTIIYVLGKAKNHFFMGYMKFKDERLQLLKSVISNIRMVKIRCLELYYNQRLSVFRGLELTKLRSAFIVFAALLCFPLLSNMIVAPLVFLFVDLTGYTGMMKKDMLSFLLYFQIFFNGCNSLSVGMTKFSDSIGSCKRIHEFLKSTDKKSKKKAPKDSNLSISIKNGRFYWLQTTSEVITQPYHSESNDKLLVEIQNQESFDFVLSVPSLDITKGEFVVVLGSNGSGKSSLVYSILEETLQLPNTEVNVRGSVSFLSQTPWVITDTIKENIVFGDEYDEKKLIKVLKLSQFWEDLQSMEKGIDTFCEENGANLSGGQRARLALARCFYHESEIMVLDDPLKALDAAVARKVLEDSLSKHFFGRTRILTTNMPSHAKFADRVIILDSGRIVFNGSYEDAVVHKIFNGVKLTNEATKKSSKDSFEDHKDGETLQNNQEFIEEEIIEHGRVSMKVVCSALWDYSSFWGLPIAMFIVLAGFGFYSSVQGLNMQWVDKFYAGENVLMFTMKIILMGFMSGFLLFFSILLVMLLGIRLSSRLHYKMLFSILHARVSEYLDLKTSGYLINRFTNDLDFVDRTLPTLFFYIFVAILVNLFTIKTFISGTDNIFFIFDLLIFIVGIFICQNYFLKANNNLMRLINASKSPIVQLASGIGTGIAEVRAMHKEKYLECKYLGYINSSIKYYPVQAGLQNGFSLFMNLLNFVMLTIPGFIYINYQVKAGNSTTGDLETISLFLQNVNGIGLSIANFIALLNQIETVFVNVERCKEFESIPAEEGYGVLTQQKELFRNANEETVREYYSQQRTTLFNEGMIEVQDVTSTYPGREIPALANLNFTLKPREKIAIVGRTGSGKTTLSKLLWRAIKAKEGRVLFDGLDLVDSNLTHQRSEMSIVSQEISIIDGTLKENLDPFFNENVTYKL